MSVIAPEGRILAREALPALGQLAAFLFIVGCIYVIDYFVRALFGTVTGAVAWIPFAGKVAKHSLHKVEQKITNQLGTAEAAFDRRIGASFHKLAYVVRSLPGQLLDEAKLLLGVSLLLLYLPTKKLVLLLIHAATIPLHAAETALDHLLARLRHRVKGLAHFVTHNIWRKIAALAAIVAGVIEWDIPHLRARNRAIERELDNLWKWTKAHRYIIPSAVFLGAFAYALRKFGLNWLRCSNVKKVGHALCHFPATLLAALLGMGLAFAVVIDPRKSAEAAALVTDSMDALIRRIAD